MNSRCGEEIVITGIAGRFPESDDVRQFKENLFNKVNMITDDNRRWKQTLADVPHKIGKIPGIEKFDAGFFGVNQMTAHNMDPMCRLLLECVFEALLDAGHNPSDFEGTKTGVHIGVGLSETENVTFFNNSSNNGSIIGCQRSMLAKNISYFLKLNGPSYTLNTACNSSMSTIESAYAEIRNGVCEKAIVCSAQVCLDELVSLECARIGVLCFDGTCKSFDDAANGYVRSEAIVVIILEKLKDAKRVYAEMVHCKINCDGYTDEGITFPSHESQQTLLKEIYEESQIDPTTLSYFEAHATGTNVGDSEELKPVNEIICKNRNRPLYIGSVKSNMGHAEAVSGLCSVIKVLIGFETGYIPPNMHYNTPKRGIEPLEQRRLIVVTEKTSWPDDNGLAAVNNFGFGGVNGHLILRWNKKVVINNGIPEDDLPRLVCASGRTKETVFSILDNSTKMNAEFISLVHNVFRKVIPNQLYNGYSITSKHGELERIICKSTIIEKKIRIVFNNTNEEWSDVSQMVLKRIIPLNGDQHHTFFSPITAQLVLASLIKELNFEFDDVIGIGYGELAAAYLNGYVSIEDVVLVNHYILIGNIEKALKIFAKKHKKFINARNGNPNLQDYLLGTISNPNEFIHSKNNFINVVIGPELKQKSHNNMTLVNAKSKEPILNLLRNLGRLFNLGHPVDLNKIYPSISYPVSRGTPMLSPSIKWHHTNNYTVQCRNIGKFMNRGNTKEINTTLEKYNFLTEYLINGKSIFPAAGYLMLAWETYNDINNDYSSIPNLVFEDIKYLQMSSIPTNGILKLTVMFDSESKEFQIFEGGTLLVSGKCYPLTQENSITSRPIYKEETVMTFQTEIDENEVYKELKLKGYSCGKQFRGIKKYNYLTNTAMISWTGNWLTFLDNILQVQIITNNTRNVFIPTSINRIVINGNCHLEEAIELKGIVPVSYHKKSDIITSGAIEIIGLKGAVIPKKENMEPVIEINKFVPFHGKLKHDEAVKCIVEIILENTTSQLQTVKSIEVVTENEILTPVVKAVLDKTPLLKDDLKVLTMHDINSKEDLDCLIFIGNNITKDTQLLNKALQATRNTPGFIISKENEMSPSNPRIQIISSYQTEFNYLLLIKESSKYIEPVLLNISSIDDFSWIQILQSYQEVTSKRIVLYSEKNPHTGLLGLVKTLLKEPSVKNISAVIIMDDVPIFNVKDYFYKSQLELNLTINVLKNGKWGSYRHLFLPEID
nr:fatty acid synthase-like [Onthophagus taurus]